MSVIRPRRLRSTPAVRRLVAEAHPRPENLVLPMFIADGISEPQKISTMPGVFQHTEESLKYAAEEAVRAGIGGLMLFGVPAQEDKDSIATVATDPQGILNKGIRILRETIGDDSVIMADTCLDEFTDHGHCGVLGHDAMGREIVDNDATLLRYADMALEQARAGAQVVAPSGMMDGQVALIREALDSEGFEDVIILAYSAKYASAFYGPFRDAVGSTLHGDRNAYQQDPSNARESLREVELDLAEGADIVMVKPAFGFLDILREVADTSPVPVAAYQVSGEYAMIEAASAAGYIDRRRCIEESLTSIRRAGADIILTYYATEAAGWLR